MAFEPYMHAPDEIATKLSAARTRLILERPFLGALVRRAVQVRDLPHAIVVYGNILKYARIFPEREMGVMLVTDMHRSIGRPLFAVPEFSEWAASITDLVLYDTKLASAS